MKKTIGLCLSLLLAVMMIGSVAFAEEDAQDAAAEVVEAAEDAVEEAAEEVADAAEDVAEEVADAAEEAVEEVADEAEDVVEEAADAAEEAVEEVVEEAEDAAADANTTFDYITVEVTLTENGEMTMEPYEPLEIPSNLVAVTDEDVEMTIQQSVLDPYTTVESVTEGVAEAGDEVVIDFTGVLEGETEPFEGGSATGETVTLGAGMFIEGFEEQIIGHNVGETFDILVTFPEDYTEELAGKNATFTITIQSKNVTVVPELTDEYAQSFSADYLDEQLNTADELREYVRNFLYENYLESAIYSQLIDKVEVISYPEELFNLMKEYSMESLTYYVTMYSMYGMTGVTEDVLAQDAGYASADDYTNEEASYNMNIMMMADKLAEDLGIEVTDDEMNEYLTLYLVQNGMSEMYSVEDLAEMNGEGWVTINRYNLLLSKIMEELATRAVIVEGQMTYMDYISAEVDSEVALDLFVQDTQNWNEGTISVYAADYDGAYFIYGMECAEEDAENLVPGTKIHVEGYKAEWSGEVEISDATFTFVEDGETYIAEPVDATALLGTDELVDYMNQFVTFEGLTVAPSTDADGNEAAFLYNWDGSGTEGDDLYFNVSLNDEVYNFVIESNLRGAGSDVYTAVQNLQIGDVINCEGYLYWYEGANPHITSVTVQ